MFSNSCNMTNSSTNSTQIAPAMTENPFMRWLHIVSYCVICLSGVCGNLMVILASLKPGMTTVSNVLIANLAVADFTVCLVNIPTTAVYVHLGYWPFGAFLCKLIPFLQGLALCASVGTLEAIAGERYWHVVLYTKRKLTVRETYKAMAVIWASSIFISLPMAVFNTKEESIFCYEDWPNRKSRAAYTTLVFLLLYFLPLVLISCLYAQIGRFLRSLPATQQVNNQVHKKTIRMLFIVVLLFGLCWLPYHIVTLCIEFNSTLSQSAGRHLFRLLIFSHWLMFANSACNPVVYAVLNKNYRRQFATILCRCRQNVQVHAAADPTQ